MFQSFKNISQLLKLNMYSQPPKATCTTQPFPNLGPNFSNPDLGVPSLPGYFIIETRDVLLEKNLFVHLPNDTLPFPRPRKLPVLMSLFPVIQKLHIYQLCHTNIFHFIFFLFKGMVGLSNSFSQTVQSIKILLTKPVTNNVEKL